MAKRERESERVKRVLDRITAANKVYERWEEEYHCSRLENYWKGKQWAGYPEDFAKDKYTINLVFPTIEIKLPSLLFYTPKVKVEPRPAHVDDLNSEAGDRAKLAQDTIQTFVDDPKVHFKMQTLLGLRDAEFRFGVCEVGYSADWIDNPNAGKPVLKDDSEDPMQDSKGESVVQPGQIPQREQLFVKWIPAQTVRCSVSGRNVTEENDWIGYYEWHYLEDVKRNKKYSNTRELKAGGQLKDHPNDEDQMERERHAGMVKLWKIWNLRQNAKSVVVEGHDKFLLEDESFSYFPLAVLKYYEILREFYPLPPTANWISPQDEMNETRDGQKVHRQRFKRRYTYRTGAIDQPELDKLETGGDGVYAMANQDNPIQAVPDAPLDPGNTVLQVQQTLADFMQISGVSGEQRGVTEAETATQANIIDVRSRIRESYTRKQVGDWLGDICRLILLCVREKMQLPFWVQIHADPFAGDQAGLAQTAQSWQQLTAEQLGNLDVDVSVEVASLSPVSEDMERQTWMTQVLPLITNPTIALVMSASEPLLRKTLKYFGITSVSEINEIKKVLQLVVMMQAQSALGAGAEQPSQATQPPAGIPAAGGPMVQ